ncbi:MAG: M20 family metallopeptidase [Candidatus Sericytochromatia bacterium]
MPHPLLPAIQALRHALHQHPELSGAEVDTAGRLQAFLAGHGLTPVAEGVGGHGLLYRLPGAAAGPAVLLRADTDALPIAEATGCPHGSAYLGRHHACGHDGHAAMLAGALAALSRVSLPGPLYALFQPAEETGTGMARCLEHPALAGLEVARAYAFHNVPGAPLGQVIMREGPAAPASTGLRLTLTGRRSHASEPHLGRNPLPLLGELIPLIQALPGQLPFGRAGLATLVHVGAEGENYGMSPGSAQLGVTLRADHQADLEAMRQALTLAVEARASAAGLTACFELLDPFPAVFNDAASAREVETAAWGLGLATTWAERPFPWSEDFGHATARWPGALVGLGAGEATPALHSPDYDFPDALLETGIRLWEAIATQPRGLSAVVPQATNQPAASAPD